MFGISMSELVVILLVVLVLINPKDLPGLARKTGSIYATIIRQWNGMKRTMKKFEEEVELYSKLEANDIKTTSDKTEDKEEI